MFWAWDTTSGCVVGGGGEQSRLNISVTAMVMHGGWGSFIIAGVCLFFSACDAFAPNPIGVASFGATPGWSPCGRARSILCTSGAQKKHEVVTGTPLRLRMCSAKWPQDDKTAQWEQYIRDAEKAESGIAAIIQYNLLLEKAVRAEEFSKAAELRDRSAHLGVHLHLQATREYQVG